MIDRRWPAGLALVLALCAGTAAALEVHGVRVEEQARTATGTPLQLNGAGVRTRLLMDVYVAALYLPRRSSEAVEVLATAGPWRMQLTFLRSLGAGRMASAFADGMQANTTDAERARLAPAMERLQAILAQVAAVHEGNVLVLEWAPEGGLRLWLDGQPRGAAIPGADFAAALLRVWLGAHPVDAALREALLGHR